MKDEIKEINIPENVLVALGDLTNGALNYYKATETVKVRHNTILDYITNLQEENKCLKGNCKRYHKKSNNQAEEINRLVKQREKFMKKYGYLKEEKDKYKNVIDKIKEYIPKLRRTSSYELDEKLDEILELLEEVDG